ncbi:unnamed protein product, partial [Meganyctiphanes norvegica]
ATYNVNVCTADECSQMESYTTSERVPNPPKVVVKNLGSVAYIRWNYTCPFTGHAQYQLKIDQAKYNTFYTQSLFYKKKCWNNTGDLDNITSQNCFPKMAYQTVCSFSTHLSSHIITNHSYQLQALVPFCSKKSNLNDCPENYMGEIQANHFYTGEIGLLEGGFWSLLFGIALLLLFITTIFVINFDRIINKACACLRGGSLKKMAREDYLRQSRQTVASDTTSSVPAGAWGSRIWALEEVWGTGPEVGSIDGSVDLELQGIQLQQQQQEKQQQQPEEHQPEENQLEGNDNEGFQRARTWSLTGKLRPAEALRGSRRLLLKDKCVNLDSNEDENTKPYKENGIWVTESESNL